MNMDGKKIKQEILDNIKNEIKNLQKKPTLCVVQVGNDEASNIYIKQKRIMSEYVGYNFIHKKYDTNISEHELLENINKLNNDSNINGILVQMPLPKSIDSKKIQNSVSYIKDVDGLCDKNIVNLITNKDGLFPCTASGIIDILKYYNIKLEGSNVVIVGRSFLVGTPLFYMLENENATVTLCHSKTIDLKSYTKNANILICAVGKKHLITEDMVKDNSIIIDVGINRENDKLYGDCDYDNIKNKVKYITPVPGGIGPMTIASLCKNVLKAYKMQK